MEKVVIVNNLEEVFELIYKHLTSNELVKIHYPPTIDEDGDTVELAVLVGYNNVTQRCIVNTPGGVGIYYKSSESKTIDGKTFENIGYTECSRKDIREHISLINRAINEEDSEYMEDTDAWYLLVRNPEGEGFYPLPKLMVPEGPAHVSALNELMKRLK